MTTLTARVVGSSVGAINASYFAAAPDAEGVAALARICAGLRRSDVFPVTLPSALAAAALASHRYETQLIC